MAREPFVWGAAGERLTPSEVKQKRRIAEALMSQAGDTSPVGHWSAALNRALQGYLGGRANFKASKSEREGTEAARSKYEAAFGGGSSPVAAALAGGGSGQHVVSGEASSGLFPASLIETESGGNWGALNDEGYGGRLQFGAARLADAANAGVIPAGMDGAAFSRLSPDQQMAVESWHFQDIENQARRMGLDQYIGQTVGGVPIDMNAIKGMAHLGGIGGAAKFLQSGGAYNPSDSNGTSLSAYGRRHGGGSGGASPSMPSGPNSREISALLADPWMAEAYGPQIGAMMQQAQSQESAAYDAALRQQDPMYQAQYEAQILANEAARQPQQPKPIEVGGVLLDPNTMQPIFDSREGPKPTGNIQEYEYYANAAAARGEQPMPFEQYQASIARAGSGAASGVGTIPAGYQAITDPLTGQITGLQPIPGGPAELEAEKGAAALEAREANKANAAAIVLQDIDKAIENTSDWTSGFGGSILGAIPGSSANDLRATIDTVKANIGFDRLQQMRDASPTGGALGGIAVQELNMLQAVLGSLDQSQSPEQLKKNLQRLREVYEPIAKKAAAYPNAGEFGFVGGDAASSETAEPAKRRRYNPQTRSFE